MKFRLFMAVLAIAALAVFVGSTGPPQAALDTSMKAMTSKAFVTEPAAPVAAISVQYAVLVVDNDVGSSAAALNGNLYLCADHSSPGKIEEVVAISAPSVSTGTERTNFARHRGSGTRASPPMLTAHLHATSVIRT